MILWFYDANCQQSPCLQDLELVYASIIVFDKRVTGIQSKPTESCDNFTIINQDVLVNISGAICLRLPCKYAQRK